MSKPNYQPNSNKFKEEQKAEEREKRANKVISGTAKVKPNNKGKLASVFISDDAKNVKSYILWDILVPTFKKTIVNTIDMILNGGNGYSRGNRSTVDKISYSSYYNREPRDHRYVGDTRLSRYNYDDIILESKTEATEVLVRMDEIMAEYGMVRVADLYDLVGITGNYTDNDYGWYNIHSAEVIPVHGGYMIRMPRVTALNK